MYPTKLNKIINLFESLPEDERRETLVSYADNAKKQEPRDGENFDLVDVRKDEECTDKVGVYLHVDENGLATLRLIETVGTIDKALAAKQVAEYEADIKKYQARSTETRAKAEALEKEYDRLNLRDDQFDISEAFISIAIALAAVAALADAWWLLYVAWGSGTIGIVFGAAGFANIALRAQWLATLLGT